jgi:hypothetical protein
LGIHPSHTDHNEVWHISTTRTKETLLL